FEALVSVAEEQLGTGLDTNDGPLWRTPLSVGFVALAADCCAGRADVLAANGATSTRQGTNRGQDMGGNSFDALVVRKSERTPLASQRRTVASCRRTPRAWREESVNSCRSRRLAPSSTETSARGAACATPLARRETRPLR